MDQVIRTSEQHQYLNKLLGFNYTIVYKPGRENYVVDALSRIEEEEIEDEKENANSAVVKQQLLVSDGVYCALTTLTSQLLDSLRSEVLQNSELQTIVQDCTTGTVAHYTCNDGLLDFKNRLRLTSNSAFKTFILHEF